MQTHAIHTDVTLTEPSHASWHPQPGTNPTYVQPERPAADEKKRCSNEQTALDLIDEASMESFPCSDPPSYTMCHT